MTVDRMAVEGVAVPARTQWMLGRCVYIRELLAEGCAPQEIARLLSCDPEQVVLLGLTEPSEILAPFVK